MKYLPNKLTEIMETMIDAKKILRIAIALIVIAIVGGYAYYRSSAFIRGPVVAITSPQNGTTATSSIITVSGIARNISAITMDGRKIYIDENGNFSEKLLLHPGYNIITVAVRDRYERKAQAVVEVVYIPPLSNVASTTSPTTATTTPQPNDFTH